MQISSTSPSLGPPPFPRPRGWQLRSQRPTSRSTSNPENSFKSIPIDHARHTFALIESQPCRERPLNKQERTPILAPSKDLLPIAVTAAATGLQPQPQPPQCPSLSYNLNRPPNGHWPRSSPPQKLGRILTRTAALTLKAMYPCAPPSAGEAAPTMMTWPMRFSHQGRLSPRIPSGCGTSHSSFYCLDDLYA